MDYLPAYSSNDVAVLLGPEGGWSKKEGEFWKDRFVDLKKEDSLSTKRKPSVHPVSLGPNILRAETAGVLALGMLSSA